MEVTSFGNIIDDCKNLDPSALAVVIFYGYALILSLSSVADRIPWKAVSEWAPFAKQVCNFQFAGFQKLLSMFPTAIQKTFLIADCDTIGGYYFAIALMHAVWLWFLYKLNRGYFRYIFADRPVYRAIAGALVPIGAFLGIAMSFAANLCVLPITFIGFGMTSVLFIASHLRESDSSFSRLNNHWAQRTFWNMLFASSLVLLHSFMLSDNDAYVEARKRMTDAVPFNLDVTTLTFWVTSFLFIWFWAHIRPYQQSELSMAARLAQYDTARNT
jgi:hypothetical protein